MVALSGSNYRCQIIAVCGWQPAEVKCLFYKLDQCSLLNELSRQTHVRAVAKVNLYGFDISMETQNRL